MQTNSEHIVNNAGSQSARMNLLQEVQVASFNNSFTHMQLVSNKL